MEIEEIEKRLEWLDSERKKTNLQINAYKDRIAELESIVEKQGQKLSVFENDIKTTVNVTNRLSQFEETIAKTKIELIKEISDFEKKLTTRNKADEKQQKEELGQISKKVSEVQSFVPIFSEVKKNLQNRIDEENRLAQRIGILEKNRESVNSTFNEFLQTSKRTVDELQVENKRVSDIQVELLALRKRLDEERNRYDINFEAIKKLDDRFGVIESGEAERKQSQIAFIEKFSLVQLERENLWKSWQERFDEILSLGDNFDAKMNALESTHLAVKKSQTELDDVNLRFDRRINELTEMHRLTEERFRQEWISFKNEDQKRWTNYSLTQEEKDQDDNRQKTKLLDRVVALEDAAQEAKDTIELINDETDKRMKALLSVLHDLMESFNQTFNIH